MGGTKGKGGSRGPAVAPPPRSLVSTKRLFGSILEWCGKFGWIEPRDAIDHPLAERHRGKVYVSADDVEAIQGAGTPVSFFLYVDANGLGAMHVRAMVSAEADAVVPRPSTAATLEAKPKGAGVWTGGYRPRGWQTAPPLSLDELHESLHSAIWHAIDASGIDAEWNHKDIIKRVLKYSYKAAQAPELLSKPWREATVAYIEQSMQGYTSSCSDKPWFYELDLAPVLTTGAWEIAKSSTAAPRANFPELERQVQQRYEELMDDVLLDKAMWDVAHASFQAEVVGTKIYKALLSSREASLKAARGADMRRASDLQRVETFLRSWMENAIGRAWQAIGSSDQLLTAESVTKLFQNLVAPFGKDHPFSCVPAGLTERIGRPPHDWPFIEDVAAAMMGPRRCHTSGASSMPMAKRRRRADHDGTEKELLLMLGGGQAAGAPRQPFRRAAGAAEEADDGSPGREPPDGGGGLGLGVEEPEPGGG